MLDPWRDATSPSPPPRKRWVELFLVAALLIAAALLTLDRHSSGPEIDVIRAPQGPIKLRPEEVAARQAPAADIAEKAVIFRAALEGGEK